jgi:hypothetical protein
LLDFELEEVSSSREVKLSNQWGQSAAVGEDIVEVIGSVGAQFDGFLQSLSDRCLSKLIGSRGRSTP